MRHMLNRETLFKVYEAISVSAGDVIWVHHPITEDLINVNVVKSMKDKVLVSVLPDSPYSGQPDWVMKKLQIVGKK